jgi:hypothetical protein
VAVAIAELSQFTVEQQARLVILRTFVQEARMGRGALSDDMIASGELDSDQPTTAGPPRVARRRLDSRQLLVAGGLLLVVLGVIGIVRTNVAIDDLARSFPANASSPLSGTARFLPGVIVNPSRYLSAVNGGSSVRSGVDPLFAVEQLDQKQAMDRWEALALVGLSLLLFAQAMRVQADDDDSMVGFDVAPFILVAAALFAGLSFFELP